MNEFTWEIYLESCNAQAAPKNLFKSQNSVSALPCADLADVSCTGRGRRRTSSLAVNSASYRLNDAAIFYSVKRNLHWFNFLLVSFLHSELAQHQLLNLMHILKTL